MQPEQTHFPFQKNDLTMGSYGWPSETELQDLLSEIHVKALRNTAYDGPTGVFEGMYEGEEENE